MSRLGDMVRDMVSQREPRLPPDPSGGLGTLTAEEEAAAYRMIETSQDLLNPPGNLCRCPGPCTGHMPTDPSRPGI
jgi:hypothetical protein